MYPNEPQPESPAETSYIAERSDIIRSSVTSTREHQAVINSSLRTGDRTMIKTDSGKGFGAADVRQELQTSSTANPKSDHRSLMQAGAGSWNSAPISEGPKTAPMVRWGRQDRRLFADKARARTRSLIRLETH